MAQLYYDGSCGMCTGMAAQAVTHAQVRKLEVIDNTAPRGRQELSRLGMLERSRQTMVVCVGDKVYTESAAVVRVAWRLRGWRRLGVALWVIPKPLRDAGYRAVARRRSTKAANS